MEDIGLMNILVWGAIGVVVVHLFMKVRNNEINKTEEEKEYDLNDYNLNGYNMNGYDKKPGGYSKEPNGRINETNGNKKNGGGMAFAYVVGIIALCGIVSIAGALKAKQQEQDIIDNGKKTVAAVTRVEVYDTYDSDGDINTEKDVYLQYKVDGRIHKAVIKKAHFYPSVGDQVDIYYRSNQPDDIVCLANTHGIMSVKFKTGVGILVFVAFMVVIYIWTRIKEGQKDSGMQ